jgi:hypothetical protein
MRRSFKKGATFIFTCSGISRSIIEIATNTGVVVCPRKSFALVPQEHNIRAGVCVCGQCVNHFVMSFPLPHSLFRTFLSFPHFSAEVIENPRDHAEFENLPHER